MVYITEIILAAVVCGILAKIAPDDKCKTKKYIKYIATLAFLSVLISPIFNGKESGSKILLELMQIGEVSNNSDEADRTKINYGNFEIISSEICKAASKSASEHFDVSEHDFQIKLITAENEKGEFYIKEASVFPSGEASKLNTDSLKSYFQNIFDTKVEVYVKSE